MSNSATVAKRRSNGVRSTLTIAALFVVSMAFDFKGQAGGTAIQFGMAGVNTGAFLLLAVRRRFALPRQGLAAYVIWGWLVLLIVGTVGALLSSVPAGHFLRVLYSYTLFIEGFFVAWWVARDVASAAVLTQYMMFTAAVSMYFTVVWGLHFTGERIDKAHFAILSPLVPFLIGVAGYDLMFARRKRVLAALLLTSGLLVVALSAVRGMILAAGILVMGMTAAWLLNVVRGDMAIPRPLINAVKWTMLVGAASLAAASIIDPTIIAHWVARTTGGGHAVNFWSRVAAVVGQWDQLGGDRVAWFFGEGFGHTYKWSAAFQPLTAPYMSANAFAIDYWYPGEFMWITPWFYAGFCVGSIAIGVLLAGAAAAITNLAHVLQGRCWHTSASRIVAVGALGYLGFLGISFTTNPFIYRLAPMFMGLCFGLMLRGQRDSVLGRRRYAMSNAGRNKSKGRDYPARIGTVLASPQVTGNDE